MIENDYKKCENIIKKASKSFYSAFSRLKNIDQRRAVYSVYAFCRYADDVTDESSSLKDLLKLEEDLLNFKDSYKAEDFIFRTLADVRKKFYSENYSFKPFFEMIDGQKMDFDFKEFTNIEELYIYCRKVASSVGNMLNPILAPRGNEEVLKGISKNLGIAMQLTNILRDVGEDYDNGRLYLPLDLLNKYGVTKDDIKNKRVTNNFINLFNNLKEIALKHYDVALENLGEYPLETRKPLYAAAIIYREILFECQRNNFDVFTKRHAVSPKKKLELLKEVKKYA